MSVTVKRATLAHGLRRLLLAWLVAVTAEYMGLSGALRSLSALKGLAEMSLLRVALLSAACFVILQLLPRRWDTAKWERWMLLGCFLLLAVTALVSSFSWPFLGACLLLGTILAVFCLRGWDCTPLPREDRQKSKCFVWLTAGLALLFFLFVSLWTVGRVMSFSTPTFDMGIFSQMFYHMKESGLPMTTVERDGLLSHFAVHVSPVYYLLLPFYCLFPTPATLQVLQAAVLASAVIPLWLLGKHHGLRPWQRCLLCAMLLLYPAYAGGCGYDIHENCFLTPLVLWLLHGIDTKKTWLTALAALLTLTVKEDAAVYVAVVGLYTCLRSGLRRELRGTLTGMVLLLAAVGWFFGVTGYLMQSGDGVMTYRYQNFMYDGSASLITVIKAVLLNPMKAVYECADPEKLGFLGMTMLPLLGLPLLTRRYERYILLIPYVLVNLMSDYQYQHDIFFQYTFGSAGCLIYLAAVNLADWKLPWQRLIALVGAVAVAAVYFGVLVVPKAMRYPVQAIRYQGYYESICDALEQIPEEASVTATTFYTTALSQRQVLYDVKYSSKAHLLETEYVVLSLTSEGDYQKYASPGKQDGLNNLIRLLEAHGYEEFHRLDGVLVIYFSNR